MDNFNFPNNLKYLRSSNKLTQSELAEKIGVTKQAISSYETGKSEPNIFTLYKLASTFDCSIDSLIFNIDTVDINKFTKINDLVSKQMYSISAIDALNKIKSNLENKKIEIENSILGIENALSILKSTNNTTEYSEELSPNINTNSELNSSNLCNSKYSNVVSFLDKLQSKRNEQLVDFKSNDYINEPMPKINLLGQVSAGCPNLACENRNTFVKVPNSLLCSSKDYFVLQVSGDSMDKIYAPNELLLIEKTNVANNGDMVIALIGTDECTLKEYEKIDDTIYLIPHSTNPVHKVQEYDTNEVPCHIIGVVKNILKGAIIEE